MLKYVEECWRKRKVIRPKLLCHVSCVLAPGSQLSEGSKQLRLCVTGDVAVLDSRDNWPWPETQLSGGEMKAEFETSCMYWNTAKVRCIFRCSNISSGGSVGQSVLSVCVFRSCRQLLSIRMMLTCQHYLLNSLSFKSIAPWCRISWVTFEFCYYELRDLSVLLYWYHKL